MDDFSVQMQLTPSDKLKKRRTQRTKTRLPREAQKPQTKVDHKKTSDDFEQQKENINAEWPANPVMYLRFNQPSYPASAESDAIRVVVKQNESVVKTRLPQLAQKPQTKVDHKKISDDPEQQKGNINAEWPTHPPGFLPLTQPSYPASAGLDAIGAAVKQHENFLEKLRKQEKNMTLEVTQKAKDMHDKEFKIPDPKPMPCLAENNAGRACFKENANDLTILTSLAESSADCTRRIAHLSIAVENSSTTLPPKRKAVIYRKKSVKKARGEQAVDTSPLVRTSVPDVDVGVVPVPTSSQNLPSSVSLPPSTAEVSPGSSVPPSSGAFSSISKLPPALMAPPIGVAPSQVFPWLVEGGSLDSAFSNMHFALMGALESATPVEIESMVKASSDELMRAQVINMRQGLSYCIGAMYNMMSKDGELQRLREERASLLKERDDARALAGESEALKRTLAITKSELEVSRAQLERNAQQVSKLREEKSSSAAEVRHLRKSLDAAKEELEDARAAKSRVRHESIDIALGVLFSKIKESFGEFREDMLK